MSSFRKIVFVLRSYAAYKSGSDLDSTLDHVRLWRLVLII